MAVKTVLLVDDSRSARLVLRKMLEKNSLNVDLAESAEDAFTYLLGHQPDAIFMDHLMPGMDGLEATEVILKNPATRSIPIVMCTSKDGSEFTREARLRGVMDILPKPPSAESVTKILQNISTYNEQCMENTSQAEPPVERPPQSMDAPSERANVAPATKPIEQSSVSPSNAVETKENEAKIESLARKVAGEIFETRMNDGEVMQRWVGPVLEQALRTLQDEVLEVAQNSARKIAEEVASQDSSALKQSLQALYELVEGQSEESAAEQPSQANEALEAAVTEIQEKLILLGQTEPFDEGKINDKLEKLEQKFPQLIEQEISAIANSLKEVADEKNTTFESRIAVQVSETVETFKREFSTELDLLAQQNEENKNKITNLQLVESSSDTGLDETLTLRLQSLEGEVLNKAKSHTQSVADNVFQLIEDIQPSLNQGSLDSLKGEMVQIIQLKEAELTKKIKGAALIGGAIGAVTAVILVAASQFLF